MWSSTHDQWGQKHAHDAGSQDWTNGSVVDDAARLPQAAKYEPNLSELRQTNTRQPGDPRREAHDHGRNHSQGSLDHEKPRVQPRDQERLTCNDSDIEQHAERHEE